MLRVTRGLRVSVLLALAALAWSVPAPSAAAQTAAAVQDEALDPGDPSLIVCTAPPPPLLIGLATVAAAPTAGAPAPATPALSPSRPLVPKPTAHKSERPLIPLLASYAVLQGMDVHSTLTAVSQGRGVEQNGLMAPLVAHPAAFVAFKAAMTAGTILATERVARNNRVAAYLLMFALDSAYAYVVVHNYRVAAGVR